MVFPSSRGRGGAQWVDVAACDEGVGRCDRPVCCGVTGGFGAVYRRLSAVAILVAQSRVVSGRSRRGSAGASWRDCGSVVAVTGRSQSALVVTSSARMGV